jgi:hypothetical protein
MAESPSRRNTSLAIAIIFFNHFLEIQYKHKYSCTYYFSIILVLYLEEANTLEHLGSISMVSILQITNGTSIQRRTTAITTIPYIVVVD